MNKLKYDIQQNDNLTMLYKLSNYKCQQKKDYFSFLHSIQIGKDCVTLYIEVYLTYKAVLGKNLFLLKFPISSVNLDRSNCQDLT